MVIRTKEELDARLADGWRLTKKKNRYWYVQKYDSRTGKTLTEKVDDKLKKYAEELYYLQKLGVLESSSIENVITQVKQQGNGSKRPTTGSATVDTKISKIVDTKLLQHATKQIDKQTKYIIEWGTWVMNTIFTIAVGETWDEKAQDVMRILNEMFQFYINAEDMKNELQKLKTENEILRETVKRMKEKLNAVKQLKELIVELAPKSKELASKLIDQFIALITNLEAQVKAV